MKTKLLVWLLLANFSIYAQQYTAIPDVNFERKLINLGIDSGVLDGKVLTSNISTLTSLDVSSSSIFNLKGIEDFVGLITLNCNTNRLTILDLSKNTALTTLNCDSNSITLLDFTKNLNLSNLTCNTNNLTSLNISKNLNLKSLKCTYNQLTNLDVSQNTALTDLACDVNKLTSLDISNNLNLKSLECRYNQLISFDISQNTALTDLNCSNNNLASLNISKNLALTNLNCWSNNLTDLNISKNVALTSLNCFTNPLTNLDVSNNVNLTYLDCHSNQLKTLDVSKNTQLLDLYCHTNQLKTLDISANTALSRLYCQSNQLTTLDLSKNVALTGLTCEYNQLIGLDFSKNKDLTYLVCMSNKLQSLNLKNGKNTLLKYFSIGLMGNPDLSCITVDDAAYSTLNWGAAKDATAQYSEVCPSITSPFTLIPDVNFENKLISLGIDSGAPDGKVLTSNISNITEIDLYFSNITDLTGIQDFKSLTSLSCMSNKITNLDISQNLKLTHLSAGYNKLTALNTSKNLALSYLSLPYNEITNLDLSQNVNLSLVGIDSNKLNHIDVSNNRNLSSLSCSLNQLTSLDLSKNQSLSSLLCSENKLLTTVNLRNGNNRSMQLASYVINFTETPLLNCIIVDNAIYSNSNWESFKDASASYSTIDCSQITAIPDPVFEDKLIALNIDKDGKNGTVLNSSIENITSLEIASSAIKSLIGIKGFSNLNTLNCSGNTLTFLDLSKNTALRSVNCSNNKLLDLNLKNGYNTTFNLDSDFKNNPDLKCIQVDDDVYANTNWTTLKDANANYNIDCTRYTLIPDSNFEDKLIALEIDKDGKNGKVATASVSKVISLDVSSSNISDISGIEDFIALTYLDCNFNNIPNINISNSKYLTKLVVHDNKLTSLDVTQNKKLVNLGFAINQISSINVSQNKDLQILTCDRNLLKDLDISLNTQLRYLYCGNSDLTVLDVSNQPNLLDLNCTNTKISKLDVTSNTKLENLYFNNAQLTTLDLSNNPLLKRINLSWNKLTSLDLSHNPLLELVFLEFNPLTTLNVQNGNNKNFILPSQTGKNADATIYTSFLGNKTLSCIQVDDADYSNTNWTKIKETNTTYSNTCKTLGIEGNVFNKATIYPNPTKGEVNISNITLDKATVYNSLGQLVKTFTLNSSNTSNTINLSGLPKGVYYVYLINQDAASAKKIIIE